MIEIYTDGGYRSKTSIGAWAFVVVVEGTVVYTEKASSLHTTNNKMELTAILRALSYIETYNIVNSVIYSDSMYAVRCINEWYQQWLLCNTIAGKENIDLIKSAYNLTKSTRAIIKWIKGHASNQFNNLADRLVNEAMDGITP